MDEGYRSSEEANGNKTIASANAISIGAMNGCPVPTETNFSSGDLHVTRNLNSSLTAKS